jgi:ABC-2 type transport system ATP-binding protein
MNKFLDIINIVKKYNDNIILNNISFYINKSEVFSLLGVNGAGKSTLSNILCGLKKPSSGDILCLNESIYSNINEYKKNVGYCAQKPNLNNYTNLKDNLYFAGEVFGLSKDVILERIEFVTDLLNIKRYLDSYDFILSGGYRQRFMIARSLMHNPLFLILDEPTVGMDPHIRRELWNTIKLLKDKGMTILLTTHYLDEAEILSDRVCFLNQGVIELIDTPVNLLNKFKQKNLEEVFIKFLNNNK